MNPHSLMLTATLGYGGGLFVHRLLPTQTWLLRLCWLLAVAANLGVVAARYQKAWPMLPLHLSPALLCLSLGLLWWTAPKQDSGRFSTRLMSLTLLIALLCVSFPKDFYLPFLKSQTLWAHGFILFGAVGRACLLIAALWCWSAWRETGSQQLQLFSTAMRWVVIGMALNTLSMFSGELWSYVGWGTPVVWADPTITTTMATWFYFIGLMHLHLTASWPLARRAAYGMLGGVLILLFNLLPDLGPFRWPL